MSYISLINMEDKKMFKPILNYCFLAVLCVFLADAKASDFLLESKVSADITYDDSVNFPSTDAESSSIITITPQMALKYDTEKWETVLNANVSGTTYSAGFKNRIGSKLKFDTAYKNDRDVFSISTGYSNVSSRVSDENILGLTPEQTDTRTVRLQPKYTRLLTERVLLSLAYGFSEITYTPNVSGVYIPYETQTATGEMVYKLSQKSELSLALGATDYVSENNESEYQLLTTKFGIVHNFSKLITATMFVGSTAFDFSTSSNLPGFDFSGSTFNGTKVVETSSTGGVFEASIDAKWVVLNASRDALSNSNGGVDQTDKISAKLRMQVTPLIGISLALARIEITELNENIVDQSRIDTKISPVLNLSLTRNLSLKAKYDLFDQEDVGASRVAADKNMFTVNLTYNFPTI